MLSAKSVRGENVTAFHAGPLLEFPSLFGQFGNTKVTEVAKMLDQKLERLVAESIR